MAFTKKTKTETVSAADKKADLAAAREDLAKRDGALAADAEIPAVDSPAGFSTSGAPGQKTDFDPSHPAIDNNPRAGTSVAQNRADMNDPGLTMEEAVEKNLKEGGSGVVVGAEA